MPTVRRAERQVGIAPLPGVRKTAAATPLSEGAGLAYAKADTAMARANMGERVARIGADTYARLVAQERDAADQTALLKANNRIAEWKNKRLFDPQNGALLLRGEAAQPLPEVLRDEYEKLTGEIAATLGTDRQRAAFDNLRSQEWQSLDLQVRRHVFGEMQTFRAGELKSTVENAIDEGIRSYLDPKLVAVSLEKATSAIRTNAPALGMGPEVVDAQIRAVQSQTHVGVISNLLADDQDRAAAAYFEAAAGQIDAKAIDGVKKALEEGTLRGEAQKTADEIVTAGGSLTEQRAKAREIADPKLRDQVMQRIEHESVVNDREKREREQAEMRSAYDILDRTPNVARIPPALWASFDGGARSAMISYARTKAKGEPVETDLGVYYQLMRGAGEDPAGFANDNLLRYRHKLGEAEFKQLAGLQLSIKSGDAKASEKELGGFNTKSEILDGTLGQYGIDPKAKDDTPEGKAIAQLRRMLDRRVDLLQAGGKRVSNVEIQGELDAILSAQISPEGQQPVSWWSILRPFTYDWKDKSKRIIDLTPADIPVGDRKEIERALKTRGTPISDTTVLDLYIEIQLRRQQK